MWMENLRLKRELESMKSNARGNAVNKVNEAMQVENIKFKCQIITLVKDIQELQIKSI